VASDCGSGPREVVDDGETGLLVPPGDAQALASAIAALLGDDARRLAMAAAARERTRARYDAAVGVARLESLLEEVAAAPPLDAAGRSQIS
jgi:glycosyltransferase involved in cell wall biosynthesis